MTTPASQELAARLPNKPWRRVLLLGVSMAVLNRLSAGVLLHWDLPLWLRVLVALSPLLPAVVLVSLPNSTGKLDELEQRINQESIVFAFYGWFVLLVVVDLLRRADVLTGFVWTTESIFAATILLLALGFGWTTRRYR